MDCSNNMPLSIGFDCGYELPQVQYLEKFLPSVKFKGKKYARPFVVKSNANSFYGKIISDNKYLNGQITHYIKRK